MIQPIKINLGCGEDYRDGYVNIDASPNVRSDIIHDISKSLPFKDSTVHEIIAQDVIEHLTGEQNEVLFSEISRILKTNGNLIIRIPDIDTIIRNFSQVPETRNFFIYGDSSKDGMLGLHKSSYTRLSLTAHCLFYGLKLTSYRNAGTNQIFEFIRIEKPPRITSLAFINQSLGIGGAEYSNLALFNWLHQSGIRIIPYVTNTRFFRMLYKYHPHKIPIIIDVIGDWKGFIKGIFLLPSATFYYTKLFIHTLNADILFLTGFIEKIILTPLAKLFDKPVVWLEYAPLNSIFEKFFGLPRLLYRMTSGIPDIVLMPTRNTLDSNIPITGISPAKVSIIPCSTTISDQVPHINTLPNRVVCISRLERGKGQDLLISAWKKVISVHPDARLDIIGEGDQFDPLSEQVNSLGLNNSVFLHGWQKEIVTWISQSQICVFPSVWPLEGFGLGVTEAMGLSKPVIAFNYGPIKEIVDSTTGILAKPGDIDSLASSINYLLDNPDLCLKMGTAGKKKYDKRFQIDIVGKEYLKSFNLAYCYGLARNLIKSVQT